MDWWLAARRMELSDMTLGIRSHGKLSMVVIWTAISLQCSTNCRLVAGWCIEPSNLILGARLHNRLEILVNQSTMS
jgi:hypothetical protein